jgi:hypothetical protein
MRALKLNTFRPLISRLGRANPAQERLVYAQAGGAASSLNGLPTGAMKVA